MHDLSSTLTVVQSPWSVSDEVHLLVIQQNDLARGKGMGQIHEKKKHSQAHTN